MDRFLRLICELFDLARGVKYHCHGCDLLICACDRDEGDE